MKKMQSSTALSSIYIYICSLIIAVPLHLDAIIILCSFCGGEKLRTLAPRRAVLSRQQHTQKFFFSYVWQQKRGHFRFKLLVSASLSILSRSIASRDND